MAGWFQNAWKHNGLQTDSVIQSLQACRSSGFIDGHNGEKKEDNVHLAFQHLPALWANMTPLCKLLSVYLEPFWRIHSSTLPIYLSMIFFPLSLSGSLTLRFSQTRNTLIIRSPPLLGRSRKACKLVGVLNESHRQITQFKAFLKWLFQVALITDNSFYFCKDFWRTYHACDKHSVTQLWWRTKKMKPRFCPEACYRHEMYTTSLKDHTTFYFV